MTNQPDNHYYYPFDEIYAKQFGYNIFDFEKHEAEFLQRVIE